jgi:hypothetical protein
MFPNSKNEGARQNLFWDHNCFVKIIKNISKLVNLCFPLTPLLLSTILASPENLNKCTFKAAGTRWTDRGACIGHGSWHQRCEVEIVSGLVQKYLGAHEDHNILRVCSGEIGWGWGEGGGRVGF